MELPEWRCHKVVRAAKIGAIYAPSEVSPAGNDDEPGVRSDELALRLVTWTAAVVSPEAVAFPDAAGSVMVAPEWAARHKPEVGGYYVVYDDGYVSYSPAAAFEAGYTRIEK